MTSRNLFFKLMKEDLKRRLWAVALIGLGCFFIFPVASAFLAGSIKDAKTYEIGVAIYTGELMELVSFSSWQTMMGAAASSLICGLSSFSYLNSRSKVDFYHGIPVRREKLYAVNYLDGILFAAIPYVVCLILAVIVGISNGVNANRLLPAALSACVLHLIYFILMYTVVVIAAMMTGNLIVGLLGSAVFTFSVPLAASLLREYFEMFYQTYMSLHAPLWYQWGMRISPLIEYVSQMNRYGNGESVGLSAFAALVISLILAFTGCFLYKKRPSEAAGKAMAFAVSCPVNRIFLTIISALGMGLFFWAMRAAMGWAVFGLVCGAVICHCVIEIIYNFDFKKLFSHKLQLIGCIAASLATLCVFRYDLTGYDRWVPDAGKIRSAAVSVGSMSQWVSYGNVEQDKAGGWRWIGENNTDHVFTQMQTQDVENVLALADAGVTWTEYQRQLGNQIYEKETEEQVISIIQIQGSDGPNAVFVAGKIGGNSADINSAGENGGESPARNEMKDEEEDARNWTNISICYTMNNGHKIYRSYYVCLESILPQIDRLMADREYQKAVFPVMNRSAENLAVIRYREGEEERTLTELTEAEKNKILSAYQEEFASLTIEQMYEESPIGLIRFTTEDEETALSWTKDQEARIYTDDTYDYPAEYGYGYYSYTYYSTMKNYDYYPVYPSFKQTIALLKAQQVEPGNYYKNQNIQSIRISSYMGEETYWDGEWHDNHVEVTITDQEEIAQLLEITVDQNRTYYNPYYQSADPQVTLISTKNGETSERYSLFPRGRVPEFVKERLEEN